MTSHRLAHEPSSAGIARERLRSATRGWGSTERVEDAMLLVTELIANAVIHGAPDIVMDIDVTDSTLRVRVSDGSPAMPRLPGEAEPGRGLGIVDALSDRWGVDALDSGGDGKSVWFELKG